eukprot:GHVP01021274.1.p1 GENE.GHVP01021274.1~~GHVP01021274.1.p1  ORF type:complete len:108 (+),score=18.55 GHVP01021274.1:128-451(+)
MILLQRHQDVILLHRRQDVILLGTALPVPKARRQREKLPTPNKEKKTFSEKNSFGLEKVSSYWPDKKWKTKSCWQSDCCWKIDNHILTSMKNLTYVPVSVFRKSRGE